ncbi:MAG: hypothetical protein HY316_07745 [Acidobacteria bacterium]|nr:hypothetical protein [Acidobacteriota bacterium]
MLRTAHSILIVTLLAGLANRPLRAQDARFGVTVPLTIAGQLLHTERAKAIEEDAGTWRPAFRLTAYPALKLGTNWYFYSALQISEEPFSYYEAYYPEAEFEMSLVQAFWGYRRMWERKAFGFKVGQLVSAFGSFPLRYNEAVNPLLDQPLGYSSLLKIRPDALPCGTKDLPNLRLYTEYVGVHFYCGGQETLTNGMPVIDLYGLPGAEADVSFRNFDARFQLTNSSPSNPQTLLSSNQHAQWTVGGGWTVWQGFRLGVSAMGGPFLEDDVAARLPAGKTVRDYPASAFGADLQWARGRWSVSSEWYRARFPYPRLVVPPTVTSVYGEVKMILTPRIFAGFRGSWQRYNRVEDNKGRSPLPFQPNTQSYEIAVGYRPNRWQILKLGYEWLRIDGETGSHNNVLGIQLVTSLDSISKAIR